MWVRSSGMWWWTRLRLSLTNNLESPAPGTSERWIPWRFRLEEKCFIYQTVLLKTSPVRLCNDIIYVFKNKLINTFIQWKFYACDLKIFWGIIFHNEPGQEWDIIAQKIFKLRKIHGILILSKWNKKYN